MNRIPCMIHGMTIETARRYITAKERIEIIVDRIHTIGDLMSMLKHAEDASINHLTAAWIGNRIKTDALMILNHLDNDFAYIRSEDIEEFE